MDFLLADINSDLIWPVVKGTAKWLITNTAVETLLAVFDPVYLVSNIMSLMGAIVRTVVSHTPGLDEADSIQLNQWADFFQTPWLKHFCSVGLYFIGFGVDQMMFIVCTRVMMFAFTVLLMLKAVLKFVSYFWAGGGN